jgi:arginase
MVADAIGTVLGAGGFPIVLGGDCSILLASSLALKRRGRYGLLFIDGHADFYQPEANPNGEAASMELAFVTGFGPRILTDLEDRGPLVRIEDVVAFGFRDGEQQREFGSQPLPSTLRSCDLESVRQMGIDLAAESAIAHLTRSELDGFFVHLDVDCLNDDIMPAVDYRIPDGLSWSELDAILRLAVGHEKAIGLEITIYNPLLDPDGSVGRALTDALVKVLGA